MQFSGTISTRDLVGETGLLNAGFVEEEKNECMSCIFYLRNKFEKMSTPPFLKLYVLVFIPNS